MLQKERAVLAINPIASCQSRVSSAIAFRMQISSAEAAGITEIACCRLSKSQQHLSDSYERFNEAKSYYSRSTCGLRSIPSGLVSLPDPLPYGRGNRSDSDRLNILDWPDPPRRYRSVQNLDTVSGLVDIVEDNWPIEGNRSIDCIYTQVKPLSFVFVDRG